MGRAVFFALEVCGSIGQKNKNKSQCSLDKFSPYYDVIGV